MEELYVESFFRHKKTSAIEQGALPAPLPLKADPQGESSLSLLQRELHKHFPNSYPVQKLFQQIEEGFAASNGAKALSALDKLEELADAYGVN